MMVRLSKLMLLVATVAAAPVPALAQSWPATVVAAAPHMADQARPVLLVARNEGALRNDAAGIRNPSLTRPAMRFTNVDPEDIPDVDVRAKDEWSDDQGLSVKGTRLAFKQRF